VLWLIGVRECSLFCPCCCLQDYLLQAEPGCDVIELVKIGDFKRLAEALRGQSGFTQADYEEYLAFFNEYITKVRVSLVLRLTSCICDTCLSCNMSFQ
jgi:hypothetical protein